MAWPTSNDPRVKFATMRMTETEDDDVDWASRRRNVSRSEFLREAVSNEVARERRAAAKEQKAQQAQKKGGGDA